MLEVVNWWTVGIAAAFSIAAFAVGRFSGNRQGFDDGRRYGWKKSEEQNKHTWEVSRNAIYQQACNLGYGYYDVDPKRGVIEFNWKKPDA